jgi:O-antigen ligase
MLQRLQLSPQAHAADELRSRFSHDWGARGPRGLLRSMPRLGLIAAGVAGLLILGLLSHPAGGTVIVLAIAAAGILPWAIYRTSSHVSWVLLVLVLIEAVAASSFAATSDYQLGALVRYPLGFLFISPFLSSLWKSGILGKGGFRDYAIYLIWALVSVSYSILPEVSIARVFAAAIPFCAFCAIAVEVRSGDDARRVMGVLLTGCGIVVAANYLAMLIPGNTAWQLDTDAGMLRFVGFLTEPNEIGNLTLATLGAGFGYWPLASGRKKVLVALAMIGALVQALMADSRSPLVGIAIGCALYMLFKYRAKGAIGIAVLYVIFYMSTFAIPSIHAYMDRGDVASFTGRQVAWDFAVHSIRQSPLLGYGYEVEGQILKNPYFPGWDEVWNLGYQTSLHDGYVSRAIGLGVPALLFWLFLTLRPAISCLFSKRDPWRLRSIVPLALLPVLILNFTESISDFRSFAGLLMALSWTILERERLFAKAEAALRVKSVEAEKTPLVRALQAGTV